MSGVRIRLGATNIPSTLSDGSLADLATDRLINLNNIIGLSLDSGNFTTDYLSPLRDIVTADVVAIRHNTDIDAEINVGNIRLAYRDKNLANQWLAEYWLQKAEKAMNQLGLKVSHNYTLKVD